ncbi:MBL fold metallo-hydrolase [Candidatus Woesearchaeota archaeon]|nr:MBL fold metallo-hydrolase [Candidatus Woesearchaeota archaeon]
MKLIILGSGTAVPLLERNCAGYLLEAGNRKILLDTGAGTIRRLLEVKADLFEIDNIFYTHLHNDHINDLGAIIWSNNYGGIRKRALNIYGPYGLKKYCRALIKKLLKPTKLHFDFIIEELKNSEIKIGNIKIKTQQIKHSPATKSIAYRIEHGNKSLVYTGDTEYCSETIKISRNADVVLTECSFPDSKKVEGHLTPSLAGKIAKQANVKRLVLTHFYPDVLKTGIKKEACKEFKGDIVLAKDKMVLNI